MGALPARLRAPGKARRQRRASAQAEGRAQAPVAGTLVAPVLTGEQAAAVARICENCEAFRPHLLLGVAGSGKTEVYLHAISGVLARGRQALVLVPEIALTPQLEALVARPLSGHAHRQPAQRLERRRAARALAGRAVRPRAHRARDAARGVHAHARAGDHRRRRGTRRLVQAGGRVPLLGARSRGRARAAARRADRAGLRDARARDLPQRHHRALRPAHADPAHRRAAAVDRMPRHPRRASAQTGCRRRLLEAIRACCARGEQSLVFINRRGYAPVLACRSCGWISGCHRCAAQLVLHLEGPAVALPSLRPPGAVPGGLPAVRQPGPRAGGPGHAARRGGARRRSSPRRGCCASIATARAGATRGPPCAARSQRREVDILVGTQILAKGHDFPHLNLVGVVNADSLLYSADFRAAERLFALLTQVAGRAGRGDTRGTVLIQTEFPGPSAVRGAEAPRLPRLRGQPARRAQAGRVPAVRPPGAAASGSAAARRRARVPRPPRRGRGAGSACRSPSTIRCRRRCRAAPDASAPSCWCNPNRAPACSASCRPGAGSLSAQRSTRARWSLDVDPLEF